jgi:TRAP-type C4-dicarboxylate transport system permease small subunit
MLRRKGAVKKPYTHEQVIKGLCWLAKGMQRHSQALLLIEALQPSWLANTGIRWSYWISSRVACVFLIGVGLAPFNVTLPLAASGLTVVTLFLFVLPALVADAALFGLTLGTPLGILDGIILDLFLPRIELAVTRWKILQRIVVYVAGCTVFVPLFALYFRISPLASDSVPVRYVFSAFALYVLYFGIRNLQRTSETDIRTTEALQFSWLRKATHVYLAIIIVSLILAIVMFGIGAIPTEWRLDRVFFTTVAGFVLAIVPLLAVAFLALKHLHQLDISWPLVSRLLVWCDRIPPIGQPITLAKIGSLQLILVTVGAASMALSSEGGRLSIFHLIGSLWVVTLVVSNYFSLFFALPFALRRVPIQEKSYPNQGITLSIRNSLTITGYACLFLLLIVLPIEILPKSNTGLLSTVAWREVAHAAGIWAIMVGAWFWMDAVQHFILRVLLRLMGNTPRHFVRFLDYAATLSFLQKVGGGYMFMHRLVQEHFAGLSPEGQQKVLQRL